MSKSQAERATYRATGEILEVVRDFEAGTLPRAHWTHAAHLTVALWYALQFDWPEAVTRVRRGIKLYNEAHGISTTPTSGYHETLTLFWLRHVRAFLEGDFNEGRSLVALANDLVRGAGIGLPLTFYSRELLFSPEARAFWVEPDLKTLDMVEEVSRHAA
ncbi:MAG: hypothetical protein H0T60_02430 [Acidobacteria bacterium]|nr:hypothetical protein [Acidobacteriota bacterium]